MSRTTSMRCLSEMCGCALTNSVPVSRSPSTLSTPAPLIRASRILLTHSWELIPLTLPQSKTILLTRGLQRKHHEKLWCLLWLERKVEDAHESSTSLIMLCPEVAESATPSEKTCRSSVATGDERIAGARRANLPSWNSKLREVSGD
jgi:hypothetical protein